MFLWDHLNRPYELPVADPWIALAAAAVVTTRIRLGTLLTPLARRRPWVLARQTVSMDVLSGGRLILGAGLGSAGGREVEWAAFGEELDLKRRARLLDEGLDVLAGLWSGEAFTYDGDMHSVGPARFLPTPVQQPRIPVWIGGTWPHKAPFRRAARWDGVVPDLDREPGDRYEAFRAALAYARSQRTSRAPFDAVFLAKPDLQAERTVQCAAAQKAAEAGATWWVADLSPAGLGVAWEEPWPLDELLGYVRMGPPSRI